MGRGIVYPQARCRVNDPVSTNVQLINIYQWLNACRQMVGGGEYINVSNYLAVSLGLSSCSVCFLYTSEKHGFGLFRQLWAMAQYVASSSSHL